jgi:PAS domain S-box-containing protein
VFAAVFFALPLAAPAGESGTVKVGYYENEVFQEGAREGATKTGYAYEYYRKLSEYTGWKYEYVYGEFAELYQMLLDGKIDLLAGLAWKEERQGAIGYPNAPMGKETYHLVKHHDDSRITDDPKTLEGKTIGVLDSALADVLNKYLAEKHVAAKVRSYRDYTVLLAAFDSGKIDVLAAEGSGTYDRDNAEVIASFGNSSYFLCVNVRRPDLLAQLNEAQAVLAVEAPSFLYSLNMKYYSKSLSVRALSPVEKQWLKTHDSLRVGFFENYMPYSGKERDGQVTGVVKDIIPDILASLGITNLKITYTGYKNYDAMIADVSAGKIDVAFPVGGGLYFFEENSLYQSHPAASASTELVYKGAFTKKTTARFAVNKNNLMQYYFIRKNYPKAEVTTFPSIEACLDAVDSGKVGCTTLNGLRANYMLKSRRYKDLSLHQLSKNDDRYFGVKIGNEGLLRLLNRGLDVLGGDYVQNKSQRYMHAPYSYRLADVLLDHLELFGAVLIAIAAAIIALLVRDIRRAKRRMAEKEAISARMEETNRTLMEHAEIIGKQRQQEAELRKELENKQKEIEAALQAAQAAYNEKTTVLTDFEDASQLARLAWFHYNFDTRIRTGSNLICELWPEDENGQALLEEQWVYPEDIPLFKQNMRALFEKKNEENGTVQFSFRVGFSADKLRYYRMKLTLDKRYPNALTGIVQDVTELAESMLKLKDAQALWNTAINSIPIMFSVKDIDDDFRYFMCNKAFAKFFNFPSDEIVGKTDRELFHDDAIIGFADQINIPTTGTDGLMEIGGEVPDGAGNLHYVKTVMRVFEDARGHRLLLAASNDATDMHRLLQNRTVINKLLEDIIGEDDFDRCIQRTLEEVCKILGASRGCLIRHEEGGTKAHCISEYVEPTHAHASFRMLGRTLSRVRGVLEDTDDQRTFVCSDIGAFDWKNANADWHQAAIALDLRAIFLSNIVSDGEVVGTVGFNFEGIDHTFSDTDVSLLRATARIIEVVIARKRARKLIMDALAQAQAADKAKSFFIASVSHEIRTPLNSVIGFAELLREGGVSKAQQAEYLGAISTSANALLMLINDVLDLSKLEANQMQIITAFTDFNALCREVMLIFTFRARENGNQLVSDVPEDLPELDIDNIRIRQILINLFGNAVKFTKNGSITLHVSFTPDPGSADTGTLRCAVSDTGIGISEEDQKKLMEPFVQLSGIRGTNAMNNGTGLGLSISKRLAVCMNGELTCTSRIGEGSTFAVTLNSVRYRAKTAPVKTQSKSEAAAPARDMKQIRILVVDDVNLNLRVAKALFNKIGFDEIYTADSGEAALELLGRQPVDLILSDMWMPGMNGAELSAEVKKDPRFAHIPIVAQTADVETSGNFDMSHFDAIILKPLTKEKLSNMVKRIGEDGGLRKDEGGGPVNLG